jgi:hypothetical protein
MAMAGARSSVHAAASLTSLPEDVTAMLWRNDDIPSGWNLPSTEVSPRPTLVPRYLKYSGNFLSNKCTDG